MTKAPLYQATVKHNSRFNKTCPSSYILSYMKSCGIISIICLLQALHTLKAQTTEQFSSPPQAEKKTLLRSSTGHYAGLGVGWVSGSNLLGSEVVMWSSFYGWRISPQSVLEAALHYMSVTLANPTQGFGAMVAGWTGDMTIIPFNTAGQTHLYFAVGPSLRAQITAIKILGYSGPQFQTQREYIDQQHSVALGGTCKVEYLLPAFNEKTNLILRAQGHIYLPPFIGESSHNRDYPADAIVSFGASLRLNW